MKTTIFTVAMTVSMFCAYNVHGQTYASGAQTNSCGAGITGGNNVTFIGCASGAANTATGGNTFVGNSAGNANTLGRNNVFVGWHAANLNTTAHFNVAVGDEALATQSYSVVAGFDSYNVAVGYQALYSNAPSSTTTGIKNTALGHKAGFSNTTGIENVFLGYQAGYSNTTGGKNLFSGFESGYSNTTASENIFQGYRAGYTNSTGTYNTFTGFQAGYSNSVENGNSFYGYEAGKDNTAGSYICAFGSLAGWKNTTGDYSTLIGSNAGQQNTTGGWNTFLGYGSGLSNTSGDSNVVVGHNAGYWNQAGGQNTLVGMEAGKGGTAVTSFNRCSFFGWRAGFTNTTGSSNTCVGYAADVSTGALSNATAIGNGAIVTASNRLWLGNAALVDVWINATATYNGSDGRFKFNVKEEVKGLDFILKLRPVTYQMDAQKMNEHFIKNMPDSVKEMHRTGNDFAPATNVVHSGFIAQEVKQAASASGFTSSIVSTPADTGTSIYGVNYTEIVVPLVKAIQEQQNMIDSLKTEVATLKGSGQRTNQQNGSQNKNATVQEIKLALTDEISLSEPRPNPNTGNAEIDYYIPASISNAKMIFTDMLGRVINETKLEQGYGTMAVDTQDLPNGNYTYSLMIDGKVFDVKKMVRNR